MLKLITFCSLRNYELLVFQRHPKEREEISQEVGEIVCNT